MVVSVCEVKLFTQIAGLYACHQLRYVAVQTAWCMMYFMLSVYSTYNKYIYILYLAQHKNGSGRSKDRREMLVRRWRHSATTNIKENHKIASSTSDHYTEHKYTYIYIFICIRIHIYICIVIYVPKCNGGVYSKNIPILLFFACVLHNKSDPGY